jgi:hypothetical protein
MDEVLTIDDPRVALIAAPHDTFRVVAVPKPFSMERIDLEVPEGQTILDILRAAGVNPAFELRVFVGDRLVPRAWWPHVRPKRGSVVTIRAVPTGGGGNGDSNKTLRTALMVVVLIVAIAATWYLGGAGGPLVAAGMSASNAALVGAVAGAVISVAGNLALMALLPPEVAR